MHWVKPSWVCGLPPSALRLYESLTIKLGIRPHFRRLNDSLRVQYQLHSYHPPGSHEGQAIVNRQRDQENTNHWKLYGLNTYQRYQAVIDWELMLRCRLVSLQTVVLPWNYEKLRVRLRLIGLLHVQYLSILARQGPSIISLNLCDTRSRECRFLPYDFESRDEWKIIKHDKVSYWWRKVLCSTANQYNIRKFDQQQRNHGHHDQACSFNA